MTAPPLTASGSAAAKRADVDAIKAALTERSGNVSAAGLDLRVPYRTLQRRITALGLRAWLGRTYPDARRPR